MTDCKPNFSCDYLKGGAPQIMDRILEVNMTASATYGFDEFSESAREKVRKACGCEEAEVMFLPGGTQTNAVMIDALIRSHEGVICTSTGHINVHEAGAIEAYGHKVISLASENAKLTATQVDEFMSCFESDPTKDHMVQPALVYISQTTELGGIYSKAELEALSEAAHKHGLFLYMDGARLGYALACKDNDATLKDIAQFCDAFYVGGTKCGALFGECAVVPDPSNVKNLFTIAKRHGAIMAKGRLIGIQFDELFSDNLYLKLGEHAIKCAEIVREAVSKSRFELCFDSPSNQIFILCDNADYDALQERLTVDFWEKKGKTQTIARICTAWSTTEEELNALCKAIEEFD